MTSRLKKHLQRDAAGAFLCVQEYTYEGFGTNRHRKKAVAICNSLWIFILCLVALEHFLCQCLVLVVLLCDKAYYRNYHKA